MELFVTMAVESPCLAQVKRARKKKEPAARTLNFCDLKCPEGRCNVTAIPGMHHSGKRRPSGVANKKTPTKKKPAEAG
jgi:hypothetical protein